MSYMPPIKSDVHITPDKIWHLIKDKWGYDKEDFFDPCPVNPKHNGLEIKWKKLNFVNPPYSREKGEKKSQLTLFVEKALEEKGTTIMLLPIGLAIITVVKESMHELSQTDKINFQVALLLGIAYAANIGGIATLIGTAPNMALNGFMEEQYGVSISFLDWMKVGLPVSLYYCLYHGLH